MHFVFKHHCFNTFFPGLCTITYLVIMWLIGLHTVCKLLVGAMVNARYTTNRVCAKNNTWHKQAIIEWSWCLISVVACCHSVKLCALAAQALESQLYQSDMGRLQRSTSVIDYDYLPHAWLQLQINKFTM